MLEMCEADGWVKLNRDEKEIDSIEWNKWKSNGNK